MRRSVGRSKLNYHDFERKPSVADTLDVEERDVGVRLRFVQHPGRVLARRLDRNVPDVRHPHVRVRLQAE